MIFLYNFTIKGNGIDFVLNEGLVQDMYSDLDEQLKIAVESTAQKLMRYKDLSKSDVIMTGRILDTNEFEVTLSEGLGQYINPYEKNLLFNDAKLIADILVNVMHRRSLERKNKR